MALVWGLHWIYRLLPLLQFRSRGEINVDEYSQGITEVVATQTLTVLMLVCFVRAIATDPGSVPDTLEWRSEDHLERRTSNERKHTGEQRFCKWCKMYKPDRCHHCRVCNSCILRMDHHCPWIANCIGFRNHKFFLLLVLYALLDCILVVLGMLSSVSKALYEDSPDALPISSSWNRFLLIFGLTVALIMATLLSFFFVLHVYLMMSAMTTIELCEKRSRPAGSVLIYSHSVYDNLTATLGPTPLLWLLPVSPPEGDGLAFAVSHRKAAPDETKAAPLVAEEDSTSEEQADATVPAS